MAGRSTPAIAAAQRAGIAFRVSAGRRGLELELAPADLLALTGGRTAALASRR